MDPVASTPDADDEAAGKPPAPATTQKKSLEQFLGEFEARIREAPSQPATSAGLALEQRAAGVRRSTIESTADRGIPRVSRGTTPPAGIAPEQAGASGSAEETPLEVPGAVDPPASTAPADNGRHRRRRHKHRRRGH
jgi:hypothetical protein